MSPGTRRFLLLPAALLLASLAAVTAVAGGGPVREDPVRAAADHEGVWHGAVAGARKAAADTIYLLGGPNRTDGKFQLPGAGIPDRQGWIGVDLTQQMDVHWHVSTFNAPGTGHSAWCGEVFAACDLGDPPWGYGNSWDQWLDFFGTVPDNTLPTTVTIQARLNHDMEPLYDFVYLEVERLSGMDAVAAWDGANVDGNGDFVPVAVSQIFSVGVADYVGPAGDQVHLRWRVVTDAAYSDEDCNHPSAGACQIDDVVVKFGDAVVSSTDFEAGLGDWSVAMPPGVGDFSKVWPQLADIDACQENTTPVFAFIDDGVVVPGTGGTLGTTWTYGPGGYVVNLTGGLAGPEYHLHDEIWSPVLDWPAGAYDGASLSFDVYRHLLLANGLMYEWHVRSSADGGTTWGPWTDHNFIYWAWSYDWLRYTTDISGLLEPGRDKVQIALGANEWLWQFGYDGTDGTPAPYFDNVALCAFVHGGPAVTAREIDVFQDDFPAGAVIDYADLSANSVRCDMARNIASALHLRNDPGDSIVVDVAVVRTGGVLFERPTMRVRLNANPLFDAYRTLPIGFTRSGSLIDGVVVAETTKIWPSGNVIANRWNWDLPDEGFFFPGDVIHYCFRARDSVAGDVGTTQLPGDTTGFSLFPGMAGYEMLRYPAAFVLRALPTMRGATPDDQPTILWWNDFDTRGGEDEWLLALYHAGFWEEGSYFDSYYTNGPSSGVGNGLGGRATAEQLTGYHTLLYTAGDLGSGTISNGDFDADPGNDVGVLDAWLRQGGKNVFITGDDVESDLNLSGAATVAFRDTWLSVAHVSGDVRPLIGGQVSPLVLPVPGSPVGLDLAFSVNGDCPVFNDFDAVTATGTATRILEFADPEGAGGFYPYAAGVHNHVAAYGADIVYFPYDLMYIGEADGQPTRATPVRSKVLKTILLSFGEVPYTPGVAPPAATCATRHYPNPFNPGTRIEYTLPRAGQLTIRIFNVRGALVRTLVNGTVERPSGSVEWDGSDDVGRPVASGVYFCQVKTAGHEALDKLTLVR